MIGLWSQRLGVHALHRLAERICPRAVHADVDA